MDPPAPCVVHHHGDEHRDAGLVSVSSTLHLRSSQGDSIISNTAFVRAGMSRVGGYWSACKCNLTATLVLWCMRMNTAGVACGGWVLGGRLGCGLLILILQHTAHANWSVMQNQHPTAANHGGSFLCELFIQYENASNLYFCTLLRPGASVPGSVPCRRYCCGNAYTCSDLTLHILRWRGIPLCMTHFPHLTRRESLGHLVQYT
jgi:hypothetical protein